MNESLAVAKGINTLVLNPAMANRHGLIAGATGTGKTVTLRVLAENFSKIGVPVFMADVKGDLGGLAKEGVIEGRIKSRAEELQLENFVADSCPVTFWDVLGKQGHPLRSTISEMGPLLLSRLLNLNDTQSAILSLIFKIADDNGLLLLDVKDLSAMIEFVSEHSQELSAEYGNISKASVGAIQRNLIVLNGQKIDQFFAEPCLSLEDLMQTDSKGRGVINILAADYLMQYPKLYSTMLLWLLSELFESLPEVGDLDKPKLVFFFDEAHMLFDEVPKVLLENIERVVRLIRSKGVGIYFVTQNPLDIPDSVLGQLGNRVQHALRSFTPRDQKAVRAAAETFRNDSKLDVEKIIGELGVGEALVSFLDEKGLPTSVERAMIYPPHSNLAPLTLEERDKIIKSSLLFGHYDKVIDRDSAYEVLKKRTEGESESTDEGKSKGPRIPEFKEKPRAKGSQRQSIFEAFFKSAVRTIGSRLGNQIIRGILGSISTKR